MAEDMIEQDRLRLMKTAAHAIAAAGAAGFYVDLVDYQGDPALQVRLVDSHWSNTRPDPEEVKTVVIAVRDAIARRGFSAKGIKPVRVQDGILHRFVIKGAGGAAASKSPASPAGRFKRAPSRPAKKAPAKPRRNSPGKK